MLEKLRNLIPSAERRRKEALDDIRHQFANCGYSLDNLTDSQLEEAVTGGKWRIEGTRDLTAKAIYWTLRRLAPNARKMRKMKIKHSLQPQKAKPL